MAPLKNSLAATRETLPLNLPLPGQGFLPDHDHDDVDDNHHDTAMMPNQMVGHLFKSLQVKVIKEKVGEGGECARILICCNQCHQHLLSYFIINIFCHHLSSIINSMDYMVSMLFTFAKWQISLDLHPGEEMCRALKI